MNKQTSPVIVNEVRRLSQDEGMTDQEIADKIKYHRVTVQRIRREHGIPTYNADNRRDKRVVCPVCSNSYYIKRSETPGICCPSCRDIVNGGAYMV